MSPENTPASTPKPPEMIEVPDWNAEKIPTPTDKDMGSTAIEAAVASDEVDESARMYTLAEIRSMREQARNMHTEEAESSDSVEAAESVDPFDTFPESVQNEILALRTAKANKRDAERMKQFSEAGQIRDEIYQLEKNLSPQAKQYLGY